MANNMRNNLSSPVIDLPKINPQDSTLRNVAVRLDSLEIDKAGTGGILNV